MLTAPCLWHPGTARCENVYVLFQAVISVSEVKNVIVRLFGSSFYRFYINGKEAVEGPARFAPDHPEYDQVPVQLPAGDHVLSVIVHDFGVHTRILMGGIKPFLQFEATGPHGPLTLAWRCKELTAFEHIDRRINGQLGWMEYCDTRKLPDLRKPFDGDGWTEPIVVSSPLGHHPRIPKTIADCLRLPVIPKAIGWGTYAERFGYANDDPPIRFICRDLSPQLPSDGIWVRYDLGTVGLYRTCLALDLPEGTVVEAGYAETLTDGRVYPVILLSLSTSCHVDRWISRGGEQVLQSFSPRGYRYMEVYIAKPNLDLNKLNVTCIQRTQFSAPVGSFQCDDPLLNHIWQLGAETLKSCSEDALIDTPTRERGQWLADSAVIGMEMLSATVGDLSLIRRSLQQASYRRRSDGVAAGLCPGQEVYLTSYALYWINGCLQYSRLTGDESLLSDCYDTAAKTIAYFWSWLTPNGIAGFDLWDFLDWGHSVAANEVNVSLNLIFLKALQDIAEWEKKLGLASQSANRQSQMNKFRAIIERRFRTANGLLAKSIPLDGDDNAKEREAGYHSTVLGLLFGLIDKDNQANAVSLIKKHMLNCFPNHADAPRLAHPSVHNDRLITPSFAHFSLQALWEAGESNFVMEQYKTCWGWMISQGITTLLEVFDTRWSHCHVWSGAPTWQLTRYALGLIPEPETAPNQYRLLFQPGSLTHASGKVPMIHSEGMIQVSWEWSPSGNWEYELETTNPIRIRLAGGRRPVSMSADGRATMGETVVDVEKRFLVRY